MDHRNSGDGWSGVVVGVFLQNRLEASGRKEPSAEAGAAAGFSVLPSCPPAAPVDFLSPPEHIFCFQEGPPAFPPASWVRSAQNRSSESILSRAPTQGSPRACGWRLKTWIRGCSCPRSPPTRRFWGFGASGRLGSRAPLSPSARPWPGRSHTSPRLRPDSENQRRDCSSSQPLKEGRDDAGDKSVTEQPAERDAAASLTHHHHRLLTEVLGQVGPFGQAVQVPFQDVPAHLVVEGEPELGVNLQRGTTSASEQKGWLFKRWHDNRYS